MALKLHNIGGGKGFSDGNIHYLSGTTAPGGDGSFVDAAPVGSKYTTTAGVEYVKTVFNVVGSIADWKPAVTDARVVAVESSVSSNVVAVATAQATADANTVSVATAQTQADLGVANAATAQATADANTVSVATAQTQADLGVANAASAQATADAAIPVSDKGSVNGVATLGLTGVIPTSQIPALAITSTQTAASEVEMLALVTQSGDIVIRSDLSSTWVNNGGVTGTVADFTELATSIDAVQSVNGQQGVIVLGAVDVGADIAGSASSAQAAVQANLDAEVVRATNAETTNANAALVAQTQADLGVANALTAQTGVDSNTVDIALLQSNTNGSHAATFAAVTAQIADAVPAGTIKRIEWNIAINESAVPSNLFSMKISALTDGVTVDYDEDDVLEMGNKIDNLISFGVSVVAGNVELAINSSVAVDVSIVRKAY